MKLLKRLLRKPAIFFVTLYAKHIYNQGRKAADARHKAEGCAIYLAADSFDPRRMVTYRKEEFKNEKRIYGYHARLLTMNTLRRGCFYCTPDGYGNNALSPTQIEKRRQAFIKDRLRLARLLY